MERSKYEPRNAFRLNLNMFTMAGIWPAGVKQQNLRYLYVIYNILAPGICFGSFFIFQFIHILLVINDLQQVIDAGYLMVTYFAILSKFTCFLWHRKRVEKLFNTLTDPIFLPRLPKHYDFMNEAMRIVRRDSIFFLSSGISATIFWTFYPLFDSSTSRQLAYTMWCPINTTTSPSFELVMMSGHLDVLAQDYESIFNETFISPGEMLPENLHINNITKESNINSEKFSINPEEKQTMFQKMKTISSPNSNTKQSTVIQQTISTETLSSRITACVKYALAIEKFVYEINDIFGNGILTQFIASCLIICATAFALTMVPLASVQFVSLLQYQGCMIIQIFIYCWRGNELTLKFSDLSDAIYKCRWPATSSNFTKVMNIIMGRQQKPVVLIVAGLFSLSVQTFISRFKQLKNKIKVSLIEQFNNELFVAKILGNV
ncbi:hypothetical protein PV325_012040 [Microctonus aethiopoides]|nr:hypothetical protein PV325_012040 [Microctonus aethiopoides]KAK0094660.1 hypothetical protein PV326_010352 [Microctonus aethiopoides]